MTGMFDASASLSYEKKCVVNSCPHLLLVSLAHCKTPLLGERSEPHTGVFNRDFA